MMQAVAMLVHHRQSRFHLPCQLLLVSICRDSGSLLAPPNRAVSRGQLI